MRAREEDVDEARYEERRKALVQELRRRYLSEPKIDERVIAVIGRVPRHHFVPGSLKSAAYQDSALPIDRGQTISQPYVVATMTQSLEISDGDRILEIGAGSGYQAAVLAECGATVYSIEFDTALAESARERLAELGYGERVRIRAGDGYHGWPEEAPFDGIIVTCQIDHLPPALIEQLKDGGRMIAPIGGRWSQNLVRFTRSGDQLKQSFLYPVRFVPMRRET